VFFAMCDTVPEDLDDALMGNFLAAMDVMVNMFHRIGKRRVEQQKRESRGGQFSRPT